MRKSIVVLIVAVLAVAAGAVVLSLSAPVLDEEVSTGSPRSITGDRRSRPRWTGTRCWICWRAPPAV